MVTLSDVLQTSSSSSSLLAADTALAAVPQEQQQGADKSVVVTSPPQGGVSIPPSAHHNNVTTATTSEHKLLRGGGGGGFERLEIFVEDEEHSQEKVLPHWLREGACVTVGSSKAGTVRYVGMAQFAEGVWVGVELDTPVGRSVPWCKHRKSHRMYSVFDHLFICLLAGKNDGSVGGHRYFHCKPGYGVLVRPSRLSSRSRATRQTEDSLVPAPGHVPALRGNGAFGRRAENRKSWSS